MNINLIIPSIEHKEQVLSYRQEFIENKESMDGTAGLQDVETFEEWYQKVCDNRCEETVGEGLVPSTTLLALDANGQIVGMVDIRHRLNEYLMHYGGHIGYSVRKSKRCQGYGTSMLGLALKECEKINIFNVLITCSKKNIPSAKIIKHNGGILENELIKSETTIQRYWIKCNHPI